MRKSRYNEVYYRISISSLNFFKKKSISENETELTYISYTSKSRPPVIGVNWMRCHRNAEFQEESTLSWMRLIIHARSVTTNSVPQKCQRRMSRMESTNIVYCRRTTQYGGILFLTSLTNYVASSTRAFANVVRSL